MYLGLGLRLGTGTFAGFDADAAAYFDRAGVTDATAKSQINAFVKGMKDLNLYNNMVCWPLRSVQNAGTGTTAYSLGGLQLANATMSGGSWSANGFTLSGSQQGSASISSLSQNLTLLICAAGDGTTYDGFPHILGVQSSSTWASNQMTIASNGGAADCQPFFRNSDNAGSTTSSAIVNSLSGSTSFAFLSGQFVLGGTLSAKNHRTNTSVSTTAPSSGTATLDRVQLNGRWDGSLALANPMTTSFFAVFSPNASSQTDSIYTLYKNTLGTGLGLP
jgi:hypothetical protein